MAAWPPQAYERQVEAMDRAMKRGDEAAEGLDRERQALLQQLRGAEQVRHRPGFVQGSGVAQRGVWNRSGGHSVQLELTPGGAPAKHYDGNDCLD